MYMHYVSFPGLGIESFGLKQSAFTLFGVDIMWYGILITAGMILAYFYGLTRAKIEGVKSDDITDLTLFLVIFGVIGARLYYLIFNFDAYIVTEARHGITSSKPLKEWCRCAAADLRYTAE